MILAYLYPTHRCNLRCLYCSSPYLDTPELTLNQWLTVVDELADLGCRRITILGGEPLLRPDVPDIIARVRARGMSCVLTSDGLLVAKRIDELRSLNTLVLSLDAVGAANDAVRGTGVYAGVEKAVQAAKNADIPVKINAVLSATTAPALDELLAFVAEQDLHITLNVMRSGDPERWHKADAIKAEDAEIQRTLRRLAALSKRNPRILFSDTTFDYASRWGDYGRERVEADDVTADDPRVRHGPRCQAGRYYLSINPDGTVYPCVSTIGHIRGGNVITDGVAAAWRQLHDHRCVACYSPCLVEQNYLFLFDPRVMWRFATRHLRRFA